MYSEEEERSGKERLKYGSVRERLSREGYSEGLRIYRLLNFDLPFDDFPPPHKHQNDIASPFSSVRVLQEDGKGTLENLIIMSAPSKPMLKLKLKNKDEGQPPQDTHTQPAETAATSAAPDAVQQQPKKITLKIPQKPPATDEPAKKKPANKRPADETPANAKDRPTGASAKPPGPKRLKLNPSKKPGLQSIRIKNKGLVPNRPIGVGYDSEASDTEMDPSIEEQFILRMVPGEDCEYVRKAISERHFDRGEFVFKPLNREGRRAIVKVRDKQYAAALVDLPCIIEGMKSWDRRGWYKSANICQMLLVLGPVSNEAEALEYPLPPDIEHPDDRTLQYPHGLTPPLRWVRRRRFRDRLSTRTIEQVERAVEDLIAQDEAAVGPTRYELVDSASFARAEGLVQSGDYDVYDDEQDAEGEVDEGDAEFGDALAAEMEAEMEAALAAEGEDGAATAALGTAPSTGPNVPQLYQAGTPSANKPATPQESSGDESEESEEDVPEDDLDDEQREQKQQLQQQREEVVELEGLIRSKTRQWESLQNAILKNKLGSDIQHLKSELALKKVSIGESDDIS